MYSDSLNRRPKRLNKEVERETTGLALLYACPSQTGGAIRLFRLRDSATTRTSAREMKAFRFGRAQSDERGGAHQEDIA